MYNRTPFYRQTGRHAGVRIAPMRMGMTKDGRWEMPGSAIETGGGGSFQRLAKFMETYGLADDLMDPKYDDPDFRREPWVARHITDVQHQFIRSFRYPGKWKEFQEAWRKFQEVGKGVHWHIVGHLQTNKVKRVLQFADMIHSVDSVYLAREIQTQAEKLDRTIEILIQVNTSGEESKFGLEPVVTIGAIEEISAFSNLEIKGLMTIGAFLPNPEDVRPCFKLLLDLKDRVNEHKIAGVEIGTLSMGMTNDYEVAIEEGSTMVRVGTAIFGERG